MLHIREAVESDLEGLLGLYEHFHRADDSSPAGVRRAWAQIMAQPGLFVYVGEVDGQLVASCTLVVVPNLRSGPRPYALIELVVTHADHRRCGYGTTVLRHALASAWDMDCYKVMLLTGQTDEGVLRFYEGAGFSKGRKTGFLAAAPGWARPIHAARLSDVRPRVRNFEPTAGSIGGPTQLGSSLSCTRSGPTCPCIRMDRCPR